jgi:hypothetical protein
VGNINRKGWKMKDENYHIFNLTTHLDPEKLSPYLINLIKTTQVEPVFEWKTFTCYHIRDKYINKASWIFSVKKQKDQLIQDSLKPENVNFGFESYSFDHDDNEFNLYLTNIVKSCKHLFDRGFSGRLDIEDPNIPGIRWEMSIESRNE